MNSPMEKENVIEKPYILRDLTDEDLYPVVNIIATVFPENLTAIIMQVASGEKTVEELGASATIQIVKAILKNIGVIKDDLYAFLSDVSGIPADDIRKMPFGTTPMMIWDIVNAVKGADFFKAVSKSF
jgi:hypothetical protein